MSKGKGKIIGALITAGIFGVGGVAGGIALATSQTEQRVAEAEDKGYEAGHKDGYEEGLTVNVGYTEEDLENAKNEGIEEGYQNGFDDGVNYVPPEPVYANISDLNLRGDMFSYSINDTEKIVSTSENDGVFYIDNKNQTAKQIFETGNSWGVFQAVGDGDCLILSSSNSTHGVLYFDYENKTITELNGNLNCNRFHLLENGDCLLGYKNSSTSIYKFDSTTKTLIKLIDNVIFSKSFQLKDGNVLIMGSSSSQGLLLYDFKTNTITKIYDNYINIDQSIELENGCELLINNSSSSCSCLYLYNSQESSVQDFGYNTYYTSFYKLLNGNIIISSNTTAAALMFNVQTNTIDELEIKGSFVCFNLDEERCLLSGYSQNAGIYLLENQTVTKLYNTTIQYTTFTKLSDGNIIINSSDPNSGILLFNEGTIKSIGTGRDFNNIFELDNGDYLVSSTYESSTSAGVYLYDCNDLTFSKIITNGNNYKFFKKDNLVFCENDDFIYQYDYQTKQFKLKSIK